MESRIKKLKADGMRLTVVTLPKKDQNIDLPKLTVTADEFRRLRLNPRGAPYLVQLSRGRVIASGSAESFTPIKGGAK